MQTLKFEMAIAGAALFALGAFVATRPTSAEAAGGEPLPLRAFTQADFAAFDRGFVLGENPCTVGLERYKMCFSPAPIEPRLERGMQVPEDVPLVAAEFRIIVVTDLKAPDLQTVRFGQTLALVDPQTRILVDLLALSASAS
ncbi:MAG: hypothetical protein WEA77_02130 [Hyphomonas sp.]|uniref:hypothetical protein n=1 Tax=Hyphomonas sp. TaxID=87 RepID=UPI0034A094A2